MLKHLLMRCELCSNQNLNSFESDCKRSRTCFILLYCSGRNNCKNSNQNVINFVIKYLKSTGCFDRSIFNGNCYAPICNNYRNL